MKSLHLVSVALGLQTLLSGCVVFPHGELVAPQASGRVLDSETLQPVAHARVTRRIDSLNRTSATLTDDRGAFQFQKDSDLRWIPFVCYAANSIDYQIKAEGYRPFTINLHGGGSFYRGTLAHALGDLLVVRDAQ